MLRPGWLRDAAFLALNGHFFSLWTAALSGAAALGATRALYAMGVSLEGSPVREWPFLVQLAAFLVLPTSSSGASTTSSIGCRGSDLPQGPSLDHHDGLDRQLAFPLDGDRGLQDPQWLPLAWLGASGEAIFAVAVITTVWGDFNHANLGVGLGPLGYVLNSPRMHLWHHDQSSEGGAAKNFKIVFSLWDSIFGTAYWPRERAPERLGYPGMEEMPATLHGEVLWPATRLARARAQEAAARIP